MCVSFKLLVIFSSEGAQTFRLPEATEHDSVGYILEK